MSSGPVTSRQVADRTGVATTPVVARLVGGAIADGARTRPLVAAPRPLLGGPAPGPVVSRLLDETGTRGAAPRRTRGTIGGHRAPGGAGPAGALLPGSASAAVSPPQKALAPRVAPTLAPPAPAPLAPSALAPAASSAVLPTVASAIHPTAAAPSAPLPPVAHPASLPAAASSTAARTSSTTAADPSDPHARASSPGRFPVTEAELDDLARRLTDPLLRRLRQEVLVDRERLGLRVDRGWQG
ncbi:hypothetical protein V5D56_05610 [Cellulosimicrobium sp. PMB13]|uniref:hypothetical protein n=1 Tax=Cellulosimicrobium sp. PMB13 TaxID=3120158 RepID=UPI003F4C9778